MKGGLMAKKTTKKVKKTTKKQAEKLKVKYAPTGVKVISILYYIGALLTLVMGLLLIAGSQTLVNLLAEYGAIIGTELITGLGVALILWSILEFFLGRGLWKGQQWSRIVVLVLAGLSLIGAISNLLTDVGSALLNLIVSGLIVWYLGWNVEAKAHFY
jgi:hypothetical protein